MKRSRAIKRAQLRRDYPGTWQQEWREFSAKQAEEWRHVYPEQKRPRYIPSRGNQNPPT